MKCILLVCVIFAVSEAQFNPWAGVPWGTNPWTGFHPHAYTPPKSQQQQQQQQPSQQPNQQKQQEQPEESDNFWWDWRAACKDLGNEVLEHYKLGSFSYNPRE